jgi:ATP-dependent Lhr-like helicase
MLPIFRRLEMRGEIRGGRFVAGVAGEQFAVPDAVERLRKHRDAPESPVWCVVSAVDPLNLVGVLTRDARVPALRGNRVVFLNGRAVAAREAGDIRWLADVDDDARRRAELLLTAPGSLRREAVNQRTGAMPRRIIAEGSGRAAPVAAPAAVPGSV